MSLGLTLCVEGAQCSFFYRIYSVRKNALITGLCKLCFCALHGEECTAPKYLKEFYSLQHVNRAANESHPLPPLGHLKVIGTAAEMDMQGTESQAGYLC
jgi:hypothetical protein